LKYGVNRCFAQARFFSQASQPAAASASAFSTAPPVAEQSKQIQIPKLYVANLNWRASNEDLVQLFSPFGKVMDALIIMDRENPNRSRGFGFVTMSNMEEADKAVAALDQKVWLGRTLRVNVSIPKPRTERPRYDSQDSSRQ
jgi:RNA recognition motif-containing protein